VAAAGASSDFSSQVHDALVLGEIAGQIACVLDLEVDPLVAIGAFPALRVDLPIRKVHGVEAHLCARILDLLIGPVAFLPPGLTAAVAVALLNGVMMLGADIGWHGQGHGSREGGEEGGGAHLGWRLVWLFLEV